MCWKAQIVDHVAGDGSVHGRTYQLAIFPNDPELRYAGAIHEQLADRRTPPRSLLVRPLNDLVVHHYGYSDEAMARQNKHARNMGILEREVAERPDDPFVRFNMALQLRVGNQVAESIPHLRHAVDLTAGQRAPFLESTRILLADGLMHQQAYAEAEAACLEGLALYPGCPDLLAMLGLCRLIADRPAEAIGPLTAALGHHGTIGASVSNPQYTGWLSELLLAFAHHKLGDAEREHAHLARMWAGTTERDVTLRRAVALSALLTGSPEAAVRMMARLGVNVQLAPPA